MKNLILFALLSMGILCSCQPNSENTAQGAEQTTEVDLTTDEISKDHSLEGEKNLKNLTQLTFGGDNAEAYFSFDNKHLVFQVSNPAWEIACDQIFYMPITGYEGEKPPMVSTGLGRTTCAYYMPGDSTILYASTHLGGESCPEMIPPEGGGYTWPIFEEYDIFVADLKGNIIKQLTTNKGYDAEATLSPDGSKIVFTSTRSGDLELWTMNIDGSDKKQVTSGLGYDGGAFFSPDGTKLIFRASRPATKETIDTYKGLLAQNFVQPTAMELYVCNIDGSDLKQITDLGGANWAPYFHPSGEKILFSTNHHSDTGRKFNIFSIDVDGGNLHQITFDETFDAFPMFSYDGKKLVFSSNRDNGGGRATNLFIADWVE